MTKRRGIFLVSAVVLLLTAALAYYGYTIIKKPNLHEELLLYIPTGADFEQVVDSIQKNAEIDNIDGLRWVADRKRYVDRVKPGRYRLEAGWSSEQIINKLRSGEQEAVQVTFNNIKRLQELAEQLAKWTEPTAKEVLGVLMDDSVQRAHGYIPETFPAAFIPDTYEVWWNTTAGDLVTKMISEGNAYWNRSRAEKAANWGLGREEVATIASIVQEETVLMSDAPKIAGVYLNRVRIGMPLQADPTIKFALKNDSIKRILDRDKEVDSPYNTYRYSGLPPGPINIPDPQYIDAVLDAEKHKYLYFCASDDMSGRSVFARSYGEHLRNARKYQAALNRMKIYR
jgi:UPF0755 protein